MKNNYPKACSICQGFVPAGEGVLCKEGADWSVTHATACLRGDRDGGSVRQGHAQAYTRRMMRLLRNSDATLDEIEEAVDGLAALARTGWTSVETCKKVLFGSPALTQVDRLTVEALMVQLQPEDSHA